MSRHDSLYGRLSLVLFLTLIVIVLFTFRDYGASWDEEGQHEYGGAVFAFYTSLGADHSAIAIRDNLNFYGGFFELLSFVSTLVSPLGIYETRHLMSALCGIVGILACWRLARLLAGSGAAFWTALLLALYPPYYGHMFINSKDIPFAALYAWSLYYLVRVLLEFPEISSKTAAKLGVATGLAMGVRVGGLLLLCYLFLFIAVCLAIHLLKREGPPVSSRAAVRNSLRCCAITSVVSYTIMLAFWPFALSKPFKHPLTALTLFSHYNNQSSPPDWVVRHLAFKLPEPAIVLIAIALVLGITGLFSGKTAKTLPCALLIFSAAFPVIYAAIVRAYFYDEIRHFLFIVPPLFCLLGITSNRVTEWALRKRAGGMIVAGAAGVYLFTTVRLLAQLHPYEYIYYNHLIGGVAGAHQRGYETEYWATSYKEAAQRLEEYLRARDGDGFGAKQYKIFIMGPIFAAAYYFPENFIRVRDPADAAFFLFTTRYGIDETFKGREVVHVERSGVPFVIVRDLSLKP